MLIKKPLKEIYITQYFGENPEIYKKFGLKGHPGLDFRAAIGTDVFAPISGKIINVPSTKGYGYHIFIRSKKYEVVLGHLSNFRKESSVKVKAGDLVAWSGNTGYSTGPHLHFGIRELGLFGNVKNKNNGYNGWLNPLPILENIEQTWNLYDRIFQLFRSKHQTDNRALAFCPEKGGQLWLIEKHQKRPIKGYQKMVEALIALHSVGLSKKDINKVPDGEPL